MVAMRAANDSVSIKWIVDELAKVNKEEEMKSHIDILQISNIDMSPFSVSDVDTPVVLLMVIKSRWLGVGQFFCPCCDKTFPTCTSLSFHLRSLHETNGVPIEQADSVDLQVREDRGHREDVRRRRRHAGFIPANERFPEAPLHSVSSSSEESMVLCFYIPDFPTMKLISINHNAMLLQTSKKSLSAFSRKPRWSSVNLLVIRIWTPLTV